MKFRLFGSFKGEANEAAVMPGGETLALIERRTKFDPEFHPFLNPSFGNAMNQAVTFTGTPDQIHDGIDQTLYTASSIGGTKFTFDSTDHAFQGICTIVDFNIIDAGETVTITVSGVQTVLTAGGTDWTASGSNATTATSLASAIDGVTGVSASATAAVVTVLADVGSDITELVTSGTSGELVVSAKSVLTDNPSVGNVMQFAKGSDLTLANFTAITLRIYVDSDWAEDDTVVMYGYDTDLSLEVGLRIPLDSFFDFTSFDNWQAIAIPLNIFQIESSVVVDAFRIEITQREGAKSPKFYMDRLQIEASGTPITFLAVSDPEAPFHVTELRIAIADVLAGTVANGTMEGLAYDKLLNVPALLNGITFRRVEDNELVFSVTIRQLGDFLATGSNLINHISDGANTFITLLIEFPEPIILRGPSNQNFLAFTISDDLSGLLQFTAAARGGVVI